MVVPSVDRTMSFAMPDEPPHGQEVGGRRAPAAGAGVAAECCCWRRSRPGDESAEEPLMILGQYVVGPWSRDNDPLDEPPDWSAGERLHAGLPRRDDSRLYDHRPDGVGQRQG